MNDLFRRPRGTDLVQPSDFDAQAAMTRAARLALVPAEDQRIDRDRPFEEPTVLGRVLLAGGICLVLLVVGLSAAFIAYRGVI
jgi:hypothetical protein